MSTHVHRNYHRAHPQQHVNQAAQHTLQQTQALLAQIRQDQANAFSSIFQDASTDGADDDADGGDSSFSTDIAKDPAMLAMMQQMQMGGGSMEGCEDGRPERFVASDKGGVILGADGSPTGSVPAGSYLDSQTGSVYKADGTKIDIPAGSKVDFFDLPDVAGLVKAYNGATPAEVGGASGGGEESSAVRGATNGASVLGTPPNDLTASIMQLMNILKELTTALQHSGTHGGGPDGPPQKHPLPPTKHLPSDPVPPRGPWQDVPPVGSPNTPPTTSTPPTSPISTPDVPPTNSSSDT